MSRLVSLLIVLLAIAVATPVLAEQRLSLNGQMRVRGWHQDIDSNDYTNTWADQRLRIGGKMSVSEGVSVTFRMDATEQNWGSQGGAGGGRFVNTDASMQWDRAHLDVEKGIFHLRAGQQFVKFGNSGFDAQDSGLALMTKGAIPVTVFYMLDNDNNNPKTVMGPSGAGDNADSHYYGINVGHKLDSYAANLFVAAQQSSFQGNEVYVVGGTLATTVADSLKLFAEIDYFLGDHTDTVDAYGLNVFLDASVGVADNVTVGGQLYYAMGDEDDFQYTILGNKFDGWDPVFTLGTGLHNEQITYGNANPYGALGNGAGLFAGRLYGSIKATDAISLAASAFYGEADEKDNALYKDVMAFGVGMNYAFLPNTSFGLQLQYSDYTRENAASDLEKFEAGTGLFVNF